MYKYLGRKSTTDSMGSIRYNLCLKMCKQQSPSILSRLDFVNRGRD